MAALSGSAPPRMSPRLRLVMCMKLAEQGPYYAEDDQRRTAGSHPRRQAPPVARPGGARNERGRHRGEGRMARGMGRESRARLHARRHPRDPGRRGRRLRTRSAARRSGAYRGSAGGLSQGGDAGGPYRARQDPSPGRYLCLLRILRVRQGRRAGRERPRHVRAAAAEIGTTVKRLLGLLAAFAASAAMAQKFPSRPVTMIVPYAAGGSADVVARPVAAEMAKVLGENVVVELRPGAGGNIGAEYVAKSARADGYTILLASLSLATNVSLMKLGFDPRKDLVAVGGISNFPNILLVSSKDPARSLQDLVSRARSEPGRVTFGSSGPVPSGPLCGELLRVLAGIDIVHVPYKGSGAVYPDLIAGRVTMLFDLMGSAYGHLNGGQVKAIATTGPRRAASLPDVPTVAESGF